MDNDINRLADLLANLIETYAEQLDIEIYQTRQDQQMMNLWVRF